MPQAGAVRQPPVRGARVEREAGAAVAGAPGGRRRRRAPGPLRRRGQLA
jgi:hypothetical protein